MLNIDVDDYGFGRLHRASEQALENSSMSWTFLRASQFMQNLSTYMAPSIRSEDRFCTACGTGKITHLDLRNIARVAHSVLLEPGHGAQVYNLTGPEALNYDEVAAVLSDIVGRPISHVQLTDAEFEGALLSGGTSRAFTDLVVDLDRYFRNGGVSTIYNDIRDVTGKQATTVLSFVTEQAEAGVWKVTM